MNEAEILTVRFEGRAPYPPLAVLGMQGEHNAQHIQFRGLPEFDGGTAVLNVLLPDGVHGDAVVLENGQACIPRDLTSQPGNVTAWVTVSVGEDIVWKSEKMLLKVGGLPDISEIIERQYPSAMESAVAQTA